MEKEHENYCNRLNPSRHGFTCNCSLMNKGKYRIIRFYSDYQPMKIIKIVKTLKEAQAHCNSKESQGIYKGIKWFDGFTQIK